MAATATQVSQSAVVKEKEWVNVFPKQVTENYTNSVTFMKQLTVIAVSMITYLKNAFPEDSYNTETFAGLQVKILNSDRCADELARFIATALQQALEAFDKKYIHQLALCFYEKTCEPENLIEYHIFEYSYNPEGVVLNINSKNRNSDSRSMKCSLEKVKARTTMLIRSLSMYLMQQNQTELPANYEVSLRLYYNEDAPEGYQAPGFSGSTGPDPLGPTLRDAVRLGWVHTPYHALVARSYTRAGLAGAEPPPSKNSAVVAETEKVDLQESEVGPVECACNKRDAGDLVLVACKYCGRRQHAVCYGFLRRAPREHCCAACAAPGRATDPRLAPLDARRRECLCVFRRTLAWCSRRAQLSGAGLRAALALGDRAAARVLRLLHSHDILPAADGGLDIQRKINHISLKLTIQRYFRDEDADPDSAVERAAASPAPEAEADPLGAVLGPLEQVSLRRSSARGRLVSPPRTTPRDAQDKTLHEYRQALTDEGVTEELPLSGSHNPVKDVNKIGKRKSIKRRNDDDNDWIPKLRSGTRTKRVRRN